MTRGSRQYHTKTRNGCGQCKKRRVRCNLEPPTCSHCQRRGEVCDYSSRADVDTISMAENRHKQLHTAPSSMSLSVWNSKNPSNKIHQLGTLGSGVPCMSLYGTISSNPAQDMITFVLDKIWLEPCASDTEVGVWRSTLESQAVQYRYLDHSAASLWTLYHSFQDGSASSFLRMHAYRYNLAASDLFRRSNDLVITKENWFAVLSFGVTTVIFHLAAAQVNTNEDYDFLEIFRIFRQTSRVAQATVPFFQMSHLKLYVDHQKNLTRPTFDNKIWDMVGELDEMVALKDSPTWAAEAYRNAIASLKEWVRETDSRPRSWAHFFRWPGVVSNDYIQLLAARDDTALTIFVYWCMIMNRSPKRWFMEDWASRDGSAAIEAMRDDSSHLLKWPKEVINAWIAPQTCDSHKIQIISS